MTLTSVEKEVHHLNWSHGVMEIDGTVWYSRHPWHHLALVGISCKANYVCQANCCGLCPYQCFHLLSRSLYFIWGIMLLSFYWFSSAVLSLYCKGSRFGYRHNLQKQRCPLSYCYKYSQYIILRIYISRWIYLHHFYIF